MTNLLHTHTHTHIHTQSHIYTQTCTHTCLPVDILRCVEWRNHGGTFELTIFYIPIEIQSGAENKCGCKTRERERELQDWRKKRDSWKIGKSDRKRA